MTIIVKSFGKATTFYVFFCFFPRTPGVPNCSVIYQHRIGWAGGTSKTENPSSF